ncbi:MAG: PQQ-binding-like beta-propeller repeat protein [Bacteroidota bacterium]
MKKLIYFLSISFFFLSCKDDSHPIKTDPPNPYAQKEIDWPSLQKAPWPMYRHDPQLTGRSQFVGPTKGIIVDTINHSEFYSDSEIAIGLDEKVYFSTTSSGTIQCYSYPVKTMLWKVPLSTRESFSSPTILNDNSILHVSRTGIRKISKTGNIVWHYTPSIVTDGLVTQVDKDGNTYCLGFNQTLFKISAAGSLVWSKTDSRFYWGAGVSFSFSPDGTILYIQGLDSVTVLAVDSKTGEIAWTFGTTNLSSSPIVDNHGNIYALTAISAKTAILFSIHPNGQLRWKYEFSTNGYLNLESAPTIDQNGNLYIPVVDTIYSLTNDGSVRWKQPLISGGRISTYFVNDIEGNIYFGTSNNKEDSSILYSKVISYSSSGVKRWEITLSQPIISYLSLTNGRLFATVYPKEIFVIE